MTKRARKLVVGSVLMLTFLAVLVAIFMPLLGGKNALDYLDNLYNSISKASAYYVPKVMHEVEDHRGEAVTVRIALDDGELASKAHAVLASTGAEVARDGSNITLSGDLGLILKSCLEDADSVYHNRGGEVAGRRSVDGRLALYTWWKILGGMEKDLNRQKSFQAAKLVATVKTKAVECAYNYEGIEPQQIRDKWFIVLVSLVFYVVYTVWYGYAVMFLFEGLGYEISH